MPVDFITAARGYLRRLCADIHGRHVGSAGNREATDFFADCMRSFGFHTETPGFPCLAWEEEGASLLTDGISFPVFPGPLSPGCMLKAPLCVASTTDELASADCRGKIVLLRSEIAKEQLMPKSFSFYNPAEHKRIISLLEEGGCKGVVAATERDLGMAGGTYPFPLIEDGDFHIPSVYMADIEGERLAAYAGRSVCLEVRAIRSKATGCNVVARKGAPEGRRIVVFAHIDTKPGTRGAMDNASGIVVLLLLAQMLCEYDGALQVEIVALNGEDYYSNPGEMLYLDSNRERFGDILLGVNIDGVGYRRGATAYSLYDCPAGIQRQAKKVLSASGLVEGEPWYQGDHGLFLMNARPALAITSHPIEEVLKIAHTQNDTVDVLDCEKILQASTGLYHLVLALAKTVCNKPLST